MIRHCVWLRFRPDVTGAAKQEHYAEIDALRHHLTGMGAMSAGPNVSPEGLGQGFSDGFTIDFADREARDAYLVDAAHKAAGGRLVASLEGGRDGVLVFDIEV